MKRLFLAALAGVWTASAFAHTCTEGSQVRIEGDAPGAISYDIYTHLYPLSAHKLARLANAQQVTMIPDGTIACTIADDGVDDPHAVLINGPHGQMSYWLSEDYVKPLS
ncbi:conserved exported hypothetical protein [Paraburkholderia tropica]|uniref:hypothetical protein n=1 Tax=Paraburkholderia TaxID=1822464 RepID=UPI001CB28EC6|nr:MULTISPECIES: hypothetical protein [Paraburkholderia]CAG9226474.1 conserved exported hypothetical protein [Paraburkholderia tropica]